ncbi:oxoglutarate-dependent flavonoid 7-O-demethylase 1-like [Malania oleifera]|uniref:oxoglutarate-dependent flavonoid 7-O-demethylase 1-like n=1 Tax=Malania oleifera TaxID=397392 RepID=UPI0025AE6A9E|nr:oxoglutarate-dependent flavonoid 7-O-demethylase 1-like [Malania oleifera]
MEKQTTTKTTLGTSLAVPCVQELAKEKPETVPARYLRPEQDPPFVSNAFPLPQIPVVDMHNLLSGDEEQTLDSELQRMHRACKEWGFFQVINHGVEWSLVEKVKAEIEEFFKLPMEEKKKYWQQAEEIEGFGQAFVVSEEQKLDWADIFYMITLPHHYRKPHLFPNLPLPFRDALEAYLGEMKELAIKILDHMARALKMEGSDMRELFEEGMQAIRINYYPPCPQPDMVIGLNPHSDSVGLTILLQINEMEGLQVKKDGMWIPVHPLPNAFVVNVGDILEIVTNGIYRSIEHRATVNSIKERLSMATFYNPNIEGDLGPAPSLLTPDTPPLFKRVGVNDYFEGYLSGELHGKSYLDVMRIQNKEGQNSQEH